jgi:pimeloyl-ACP methyl ester carboxylesterase
MRRIGMHMLAALAALALPSLSTPADAKTTDELRSFCISLTGRTIAPDRIGLPSAGGKIISAEIATLTAANGASAQYCKVMAAIAPLDPKSYPINIEINLPLAWNGKAVQYGGGGFNGVLITGLDPLRDQPPDLPPPVVRGYMTFGTDSGHVGKELPEIQAFALNDEALVNFAYAAYKKTRDLALEVAGAFYGSKPERLYYFGGSEGGREGLTMAQRFPDDYDGIVSIVPVINWVALQSAGNRTGIVQQNGGWLDAAKLALVRRAVIAACDADDGLADGVISRYEDCAKKFDAKTLRCPDGKDAGDTCLSDAQVKAIISLHTPYEFSFALANGLTSYPGYNWGHEDQPDGMLAWVMGPKPAAFPLPDPAQQGRQWYYGHGGIRYLVARDPTYITFDYAPEKFRERVLEISKLMDSTNPDLSAFAKHGGKLLLKDNAHDFAKSANNMIAYYKSVVARMGRDSVDGFVRFYVNPGVSHSGAGVSGTDGSALPRAVDFLGVLDAWVTKGDAPETLTQTAQAATPPFTVSATRPLCRYPAYPHYKGGPPNEAASFACRDAD